LRDRGWTNQFVCFLQIYPLDCPETLIYSVL
jgi:hypothetical protein